MVVTVDGGRTESHCLESADQEGSEHAKVIVTFCVTCSGKALQRKSRLTSGETEAWRSEAFASDLTDPGFEQVFKPTHFPPGFERQHFLPRVPLVGTTYWSSTVWDSDCRSGP